jgi:putative Mn2+ efflux pump MntP
MDWNIRVRTRAWTVPVLALPHTVLVGWVAWYLAEMRWSSAPASASPTPLPSLVASSAWIAGSLCLCVLGVTIAVDMVGQPWRGPDPTVTLPRRAAVRAASAWIASVIVILLVAIAPTPIYVVLSELGALRAADAAFWGCVQAVLVTLSPLVGVAIGHALSARSRRW